MSPKRISRKIIKITAWSIGILGVLLIAFHFWFINHAEELVENLVSKESNGHLKLKVKKFKFNWFSRNIELRNAVFYSVDSNDASVSYQFAISRLKVQIKEVMPLIFEKRFLIDSMSVIDPDIRVTRRFNNSGAKSKRDTTLSLPQEMGRIYHSIQDALQVLKVERFQIDNGKFSLVNESNPGEPPIRITNLYFHLDNLQVDTSQKGGADKILFSDNVALQTTNQDILFPDGRHRLSFSNFRINIRNRLAEFDSCTISAIKGDSTDNSFRVFFDKLKMTNIDFDTLYHAEVIKADSVYCINPRFSLDVDLQKKKGPVAPPQLDELIQQLTGDLQLAFVVVQNGSFDIKTVREGRPSSFSSNNNNFELQGLRIKKDAPKPLVVDRFAMAIRNYENFIRDSTYGIQFDSIILNNDRISLSNFTYQELRNGKTINSLSMPQFELYGLSWDRLIFDQQLKAKRVALYQPVINYDFTQGNEKGTKNVFGVLASIGSILQLNSLNVIDGQVNLLFKNKVSLRLEHTNMSVLGEELVASRKVTSIRRSVDMLNFQSGIFTMGSLSAQLTKAAFSGVNNSLRAATIQIDNKGMFNVHASDVGVNSFLLDDQIQRVSVNGITWSKADINLQNLPGKSTQQGPVFELTGIHGRNTKLIAGNGAREVRLNLSSLEASNFVTGKPARRIDGLKASGDHLFLKDSNMLLQIEKLQLTDGASSQLMKINYRRVTGTDSAHVQIPKATFIPDLNALINGKIATQDLRVEEPDMQLYTDRLGKTAREQNRIPELTINNLQVIRPTIQINNLTEKGHTTLTWYGKVNDNSMTATGIQTDPVAGTIGLSTLGFVLDHFKYISSGNRGLDARKGTVKASLHNLHLEKNETGGWDWAGTVNDLTVKDFELDSLGKSLGKLEIKSARLQSLTVSSGSLLSPLELVSNNTRFRLREISGSFIDKKDRFHWHNASYDRNERTFSIDSFSYHPSLDRDTYIRSQPYQSDYLTVSTGEIKMGPFDIDRYIKDTILDLGTLTINKAFLTDFRDKRIARKPGMVTLLPAAMLKEIPARLAIDTVIVNDALVEYEEVNEKNNKAGRIAVSRLNGRINKVRNFGLLAADSLEVNATAYLEDQIFTRLHTKESYTDTAGGFWMTGSMGPSDLRILNPVLESLASVQLQSGYLDTMTMRVAGREYHAFGEMQLFYHDLKVKVVRADTTRKSFLAGLFTFAANTIIRNKNYDKTSPIFFRRFRDRSAINYLVKIALSGFASGIGVKKNKRLLRQNKDEIESRPLPLIK